MPWAVVYQNDGLRWISPGGFSLTGAVRLFALAQIGMVSQAELVLLLGRSMSTRFLESMGVLSSGLSIARTLASPGSIANSMLVDARNTIERTTTPNYNADPSLGIDHGGWDASSDSEGGSAVEGSEEHFDENVAEEEDSTDCEDGSDEEVRERVGVIAEKARRLKCAVRVHWCGGNWGGGEGDCVGNRTR